MDVKKYTKQFILPPEPCMGWAEKNMIEHAPVWCSVDLRDGNQALIEPMGLETKLEFFNLLVEIGFKEIEVGFPAASETEYDFVRALIDRNLIPDDVTIQVLTQAREHIIKKTFEAIRGAKNVIVHVYNSTSVAQREQVFRKDKEAIKQIAVDGAKLLKKLTDEAGADYRFEYSPESFTGTEPDYALEVCNAVLDVWQPTAERKAVINLPATVENAMPHVYAQQVEYMCKHLKFRENVVVSLHPHNDRGCGVASAEFGLLAGADRVEGTLFGNGERTGNCDVVTLAMNMYSQGVDPGLDFSDMPEIADAYEQFTTLKISPRQPYAGELVFAAFSGSPRRSRSLPVSPMRASSSLRHSPAPIRTPSPRGCTGAPSTAAASGTFPIFPSTRTTSAASTIRTSSASTRSRARAAWGTSSNSVTTSNFPPRCAKR